MRARKNIVYRVLRGGGYGNVIRALRVTNRFDYSPVLGDSACGFRFVVRSKK